MDKKFGEYIYGVMEEQLDDGRVWRVVPNANRRERVTRCRDCEFYTTRGCERWHFAVPDMSDGFCAWAVTTEWGEE